jgi:hypothetical protein
LSYVYLAVNPIQFSINLTCWRSFGRWQDNWYGNRWKFTLNRFVCVTSVFWSFFRMSGSEKEATGRGGWPKHWHQNRKRILFQKNTDPGINKHFLVLFS